MVHQKTFTVPYKRKRVFKTDYRLRKRLLASGELRFVVRRSLNNLIIQVIHYYPDGDRVLVTSTTRELEKNYGWKAHKGSIPSAYLAGFLCGLKAKKKGIKKAIADFGLYDAIKGCSLYAAVKGAIDGGLNIPFNEKVLPSAEALSGKCIEGYANILLSDSEKYKKQFGGSIKKGFKPEQYTKFFEEVKKKIMESNK